LPSAADVEEEAEPAPKTMGLTVDATDGCCTVCRNRFEDLTSDELIPVGLILYVFVCDEFKAAGNNK
jgi:hypothetical protein